MIGIIAILVNGCGFAGLPTRWHCQSNDFRSPALAAPRPVAAVGVDKGCTGCELSESDAKLVSPKSRSRSSSPSSAVESELQSKVEELIRRVDETFAESLYNEMDQMGCDSSMWCVVEAGATTPNKKLWRQEV